MRLIYATSAVVASIFAPFRVSSGILIIRDIYLHIIIGTYLCLFCIYIFYSLLARVILLCAFFVIIVIGLVPSAITVLEAVLMGSCVYPSACLYAI